MIIYFDEDGVAREYDDTYDITIHCESQEDQDAVWAILDRRWIPCSERMPNEDEEVLVTSSDGIYIAVYRITWDNKILWFDDVEGKSLHNVTAWMPLPEPYKEEGE